MASPIFRTAHFRFTTAHFPTRTAHFGKCMGGLRMTPDSVIGDDKMNSVDLFCKKNYMEERIWPI